MSETTGGDHEGQASPSEGASTQDGPEPVSEPEVIEVAPGKTVAVITPKLVYQINGETKHVYDVPAETTKAIDDFVVPEHYRREGAREASFMHSLGAYCVSADKNNSSAVYHCLSSKVCVVFTFCCWRRCITNNTDILYFSVASSLGVQGGCVVGCRLSPSQKIPVSLKENVIFP